MPVSRINTIYNSLFKFLIKTQSLTSTEKKKIIYPVSNDLNFHINITRILSIGLFYTRNLSDRRDTAHNITEANFFLRKFFSTKEETFTFQKEIFFSETNNFCKKNELKSPIAFKLQEWEKNFSNLTFPKEIFKQIDIFFEFQVSKIENPENREFTAGISIIFDEIGKSTNINNCNEKYYPKNVKILPFIELSINLGKNFQLFQENQQKLLQKGIYYSPMGEIQFIIIFSIWNACCSHFSLTIDEKKNLIQDLSGIYASSLMKIKNKKNFSFFNTKNSINLITFIKKQKILDPACGSGLFLANWIVFLKKLQLTEFKISSKIRKIKSMIYGIDINPFAIIISDFLLWGLKNLQIFNSKEIANTPFVEQHLLIKDFILLDKNSIPKFDLIIGNPPYIRNRDLTHPFSSEILETIQYRKDIRDSLNVILPGDVEFSARIDYSLYFYLHSINLLSPLGLCTFICSNSWMNVKYGYNFQEYLINDTKILGIFESLHHSFSNAQIKTVITAFQKPLRLVSAHLVTDDTSPIFFVRIMENFENYRITNLISQISEIETSFKCKNSSKNRNDNSKNYFKKDFLVKTTEKTRLIAMTPLSLRNFNITSFSFPKDEYQGFNWNNYFFYAPSWFLGLWRKLGTKVIKLKDIAQIKRGITTNCNDFFILEKIDENQYKNGYGHIFILPTWSVSPILNSPRDIEMPLLNSSKLTTFLFDCPGNKEKLIKSPNSLENRQVLEYVDYGEKIKIKIKRGSRKGDFYQRSYSLTSFIDRFKKNSNTWYQIIKEKKSDERPTLFIQKIFDTQYKIGICKNRVILNNTFYQIIPNNQYIGHEELIFGLLQSVVMMISLELQGRLNFGGGALDTATFDIENILIPNPELITENDKQKIKNYAQKIQKRKFLPSTELFGQDTQLNLDKLILKYVDIDTPLKQLYTDLSQIQEFRTRKA